MPTRKQDEDFAQEMQGHLDHIVISSTALDAAIEYISKHLNPDDVFSDKDLEGWAESNGYTKE